MQQYVFRQKVGCKKDCEQFKEWAELHALAKKEYEKLVQGEKQAKWQHFQIMTTVMGNKHRSRRK